MKKEIMERIEELGYKVEIREYQNKIKYIFRKKSRYYEIHFFEGPLTYYFYTSFQAVDDIEKEILMFLIEEKEQEAKQKGKWLLINCDMKKELIKMIEEKNYVSIDEKSVIDTKELEYLTQGEIEDKEFYLSVSSFEQIKKQMRLYEHAKKFLSDYAKKETLYYFRTKYRKSYVHIQGYDMTILFEMKKNELEVNIRDKKTELIHTFRFHKMDEFVQNMEDLLQKIIKQQRIKKLFRPSSFFFEKLSNEFVFATKEMKQKIYDFLKQNHTPEEIEKMAAFYVKSTLPKVHYLNKENRFVYLNNKGFILDVIRNDVYVVEKSPQIKEDIRKVLHAKLEEELTKSLEDIS
mgnify:CR=1 FL=1